MKSRTDIIIVGAGIIGSAIAYNLRKRGIDVIVLERDEAGSHASSAAAGLLAPLGPLPGPGPYADLLLTSFSLFPTLVPELEAASGLPLEYEQNGALRTVLNPKNVPNLQKRLKAWEPLGLTMHWLTGDEAREREPLLGPKICAAIYAPEESQIRATQITRAFTIAAEKLGATFYAHSEAIDIKYEDDKVTGIQTSQGEVINCEHLILATGSWAASYEKWLNINLPVNPVKGQIISLQKTQPSIKHIIFGEGVYVSPKEDSLIVGATQEDAGFNTETTEAGTLQLKGTGSRLVPTLQQSPLLSAWAGLRPGTPDKRPILGPALGWKNVTLAVGHNAVGIILSAITGQTIAELVATGQTAEIIRPFSVERFQTQL